MGNEAVSKHVRKVNQYLANSRRKVLPILRQCEKKRINEVENTEKQSNDRSVHELLLSV